MYQKSLSLIFTILIVLTSNAHSAEYQGNDLDGESFSCTVFSYDAGNYYYLTCEFSGSDVYLHFDNGGYIVVSMGDDEIDDPSSISAFDYDKGNYWDLDIDL